jgi:hypothetical protein
MSVNANPSSGYFYCGRCQENVSQSTYRRHQIMMSNKRPRTEQERHEFSSSSSDSDIQTAKCLMMTMQLIYFKVYIHLTYCYKHLFALYV